jgi:hypothetical protein
MVVGKAVCIKPSGWRTAMFDSGYAHLLPPGFFELAQVLREPDLALRNSLSSVPCGDSGFTSGR